MEAAGWQVARFVGQRAAVVCGVGLVIGTLISFDSWFVYGVQNYPLAYLPFPFLVWGSLRFGQRGATTGTLLVSALAIHSLLGARVLPSDAGCLTMTLPPGFRDACWRAQDVPASVGRL